MGSNQVQPPRSEPWVGTKPNRPGHCHGLASGPPARPGHCLGLETGAPDRDHFPGLATRPPSPFTTLGWHQAYPPWSLPWVCTRPAHPGHCLGLEPGAPDQNHCPGLATRPPFLVTALGWNKARPHRSLPGVGTRPARPGNCLVWQQARLPRITALCWHQARPLLSLPWVGTRPTHPDHCPGLAPGPLTLVTALGWHRAPPPRITALCWHQARPPWSLP